VDPPAASLRGAVFDPPASLSAQIVMAGLDRLDPSIYEAPPRSPGQAGDDERRTFAPDRIPL